MNLIFNEIICNTLSIDEDIIKEFLEWCKQVHEFPTKDNFIEWLEDTYYISDLIEHETSHYTLTDSQLNDFIKTINND